MAAPATINDFVELGCKARLFDKGAVDKFCEQLSQKQRGDLTPKQLATAMVKDGLLSTFQAQHLLVGKWRGFILANKYRIRECIGSGGMGSVYLCEHLMLQRKVAIKILPISQAKDPANLQRFYREAQAVAALNHDNIVRAHDIDNDQDVHFLVMEFVDGNSLQEIVKNHGPLSWQRAADYIAQAARGLQHAHQAGLVHRDIKPANLLLNRDGVIKILDLGLARFFHDTDQLTRKHDAGAVLGTADYLSPEQALDSHQVDIRGDIYSLGATFYFLLSGHAPFHDKSVTQKLFCHQMREPPPIRSIRRDVPEEIEAVLNRMMVKKREDRYQRPLEVAQALQPWLQSVISAPPDEEMPEQAEAPIPATENNDSDESANVPETSQSAGRASGSNDSANMGGTLTAAAEESIPPYTAPESNASLPTRTSMALDETDPFALEELGQPATSLISEDSIFFSKAAHPGSSRRNRPVESRSFPIIFVLSAVVLVLGIGGLFLYSQWASSTKTLPETPNPPPNQPRQDVPKSPYQAEATQIGILTRVFEGHRTPITSVALSPKGKRLITAAQERSMKFWEPAKSSIPSYMVGHGQPVTQVVMSSGGELAVSCGMDGLICWWDAQSGSRLERVEDLTEKPLYCVAISPDETHAICGGKDSHLYLSSLKKVVRKFRGHTRAVRSVAIAADGVHVLSGSDDETVRLWHLQTGKQIREWTHHKGSVSWVTFSPEGRFGVSCGEDQTVVLFDVNDGKPLHTLRQHAAPVTAAQFSADGRYLISADEDGQTIVVETMSGKEVYRYKKLPAPITCMSLSRDGRVLALGCADQSTRLCSTPGYLHSLPSGPVHVYKGNSKPVEALAVSPDGRFLASGGQDRKIRIWHAVSGKMHKQLRGHKDTILHLEFSPDGTRLLSTSADKTCREWLVKSGKPLQVLKDHQAAVNEAHYAADGQRILSAGNDGVARLWTAEKGKVHLIREFKHGKAISAVAWSPDHSKIATAGADKMIRLWESATGKEMQQLKEPAIEARQLIFRHPDRLLVCGNQSHAFLVPLTQSKKEKLTKIADQYGKINAAALSADGQFVVTGNDKGTIIIWSMTSGQPLQYFHGHNGPVHSVAFSADGMHVYSAGQDRSIRSWRLLPFARDGKATLNMIVGTQPNAIDNVVLSPAGGTALTTSADGIMRFWDVRSGKTTDQWDHQGIPIKCAAFSPNGQWVMAGGVDGIGYLWQRQTKKVVKQLKKHVGEINAVGFSPDGQWIVTGGQDHSARIWDPATGKEAARLSGHQGEVTAAAFVGSQFVLTAGADHTLRLWDKKAVSTIKIFEGHDGPVRSLAISPNGKLAISGSDDETVCLWEIESGELLHRFTGHTDRVLSVAFSPDGLRALSAGADNTIYLWDIENRKQLATMTGHKAAVTSIQFTADGRQAVSAGADKTLRLWDLPVDYPCDGLTSKVFGR